MVKTKGNYNFIFSTKLHIMTKDKKLLPVLCRLIFTVCQVYGVCNILFVVHVVHKKRWENEKWPFCIKTGDLPFRLFRLHIAVTCPFSVNGQVKPFCDL